MYRGPEEGLEEEGKDVTTWCSLGDFGSDVVSFKLALVSPFIVEAGEVAALAIADYTTRRTTRLRNVRLSTCREPCQCLSHLDS